MNQLYLFTEEMTNLLRLLRSLLRLPEKDASVNACVRRLQELVDHKEVSPVLAQCVQQANKEANKDANKEANKEASEKHATVGEIIQHDAIPAAREAEKSPKTAPAATEGELSAPATSTVLSTEPAAQGAPNPVQWKGEFAMSESPPRARPVLTGKSAAPRPQTAAAASPQ